MCSFVATKHIFYGQKCFVMLKDGLQPDPEKARAIKIGLCHNPLVMFIIFMDQLYHESYP